MLIGIYLIYLLMNYKVVSEILVQDGNIEDLTSNIDTPNP